MVDQFQSLNTKLIGLSIDSLHSHLAWTKNIETIDLDGIIRTILYYPMSTGRNLPEIIRILQSLQLHDAENVSTPANWQPGDDAIIGAPQTLEEAEARMASDDEDLNCVEWYLTFKKM